MAFQNEVSPNRTDRHQGRLAYLTDDFLPKEITGVMWETAQEASLVLRLGRQIPVGYGETIIPVQSVEPEVGQVGVGTRPQDREGYRKPVSGIAWDQRSFAPIKMATIVTASEEFARANVNGMWSDITSQLARAIGRGIDLAVFHGKRPDSGDPLLGISANSYVNLAPSPIDYPTTGDTLDVDLTNAWATLVNKGYNPTAWAIDQRFVPAVITARDAQGNPMFQNSLNLSQQSLGTLVGLPVEQGRAVSGVVGRGVDTGTRAVLGDWSRMVYGYADQVRVKVTDVGNIQSANGDQVNLWQTNQVAVLIETTFGWLVDPNAFVRLTDNASIVPGTLVPAGESVADDVPGAPNSTS